MKIVAALLLTLTVAGCGGSSGGGESAPPATLRAVELVKSQCGQDPGPFQSNEHSTTADGADLDFVTYQTGPTTVGFYGYTHPSDPATPQDPPHVAITCPDGSHLDMRD